MWTTRVSHTAYLALTRLRLVHTAWPRRSHTRVMAHDLPHNLPYGHVASTEWFSAFTEASFSIFSGTHMVSIKAKTTLVHSKT
ncbi:hypothetical protein PVK06_018351 [Gossypium arboreum]|uniref:Secreted protein n=1 Tax=Gossypium arboreum TaxID=29729 RepID=A0ABR0Q607_GOSAR|nr:hypothetical protein PVK06_018351 [Gossypium arboreum]